MTITNERLDELIAWHESFLLNPNGNDTLIALRELRTLRDPKWKLVPVVSPSRDNCNLSPAAASIVVRLRRCESSQLHEVISTCFAAADFIKQKFAVPEELQGRDFQDE